MSSSKDSSVNGRRKGDHKFWATQPVPDFGDSPSPEDSGAIEEERAEAGPEPLWLPEGFQWSEVELEEAGRVEELARFLHRHYVQDPDGRFRLTYSPDFLRWALGPPRSTPQWFPTLHWLILNIWAGDEEQEPRQLLGKSELLGVRGTERGRLVGFIGAGPLKVRLPGSAEARPLAAINFLCVHGDLRDKRLAPLLIRELTRRLRRSGIAQAVYTASAVLPRPLASCGVWQRPLRPTKLAALGFWAPGPRLTAARSARLHRLPDGPRLPGLRTLAPHHLQALQPLLNNYQRRHYDLAVEFSLDELAHYFLPRPGVVTSFVVVDSKGNLTDFFSYYTLRMTVTGSEEVIKAAHAFYHAATETPLDELWSAALRLAGDGGGEGGQDVFTALDAAAPRHPDLLPRLKFVESACRLHVYAFNWRCPTVPPACVGLFLP